MGASNGDILVGGATLVKGRTPDLPAERTMPSVKVGRLTLHYEEAGEGPPLVFLPGLGGDSRAFSVTARQLAAEYRTLAWDARDVGRSDRADGPYTTADLADDAAGWLEAVGAG